MAHRIKAWMPKRAGNYDGTSNIQEQGAFPKIITIVRNPLGRAWSSYKYNYVQPALDKIKRKNHFKKVEKEKPDEYYMEKYLFSFEELLAAELKALRKCLQPNGFGELDTALKYKRMDQWRPEFSRREEKKLPGLVVIDEYCYGNQLSKSIPRRQWEDLVHQNPDKVINVPNIFLVQSLIGRSLYTLPLEWWYAIYPKDDLYVVCNEGLKNEAAKTMSDLSDFLGLPEFNFTAAVNAGMYNVGENRGYDKPTKLDPNATAPQIPISDQLREEILNFIEPYNERLFELIGKRCNWCFDLLLWCI